MLFSLEALNAAYGDALLLHYATGRKRRRLLVDGGPPHCYASVLSRRLGELREQVTQGSAPLPLELILVSHFDDDHIRGISDLLTGAEGKDGDLVASRSLWLNTFADLLDEHDELRLAAGLAHVPGIDKFARAEDVEIARSAGDFDSELSVARSGVDQARDVKRRAAELGIEVTDGAGGLVMAPAEPRTLPGGLRVTVIAPDETRIQHLRKLWNAESKDAALAETFTERMAAAVAHYDDVSPANLASIVIHVRLKDKTMLLTGDARGDHILDGLRAARLLGHGPGGALELDVLKLQHHGSNRNFEPGFFASVRARHYVISANGRYGNPETDTLELIAESRADDDFSIVLTNHDSTEFDLPRRLDAFVEQQRAAGRRFTVRWRTDPALSIVVDAGDDSVPPRSHPTGT